MKTSRARTRNALRTVEDQLHGRPALPKLHWDVLLGVGAVALAGAIAWRTAATLREPQRLLRSGEIRRLEDVWRTVGKHRVFARVSTGATRSAPPVVLVHGWGMSSSYFVPTAERLAAAFDVYAPDLLGHGRTDTPDHPQDIAGLARALFDWLDVMQLERVSLVGHSMGGQIAVEAALQQPARVDRLVLVGLASDPQGRNTAEQFRRLVVGSAFDRASLARPVLKDLARMGRRLLPELRFMLDDPIEHKLPKITAPVMLIRGGNDLVAPQRWIEDAARLLGGAPVAVIPGSGHAVNFSAPEALCAAMQPFLARPTAVGTSPV